MSPGENALVRVKKLIHRANVEIAGMRNFVTRTRVVARFAGI